MVVPLKPAEDQLYTAYRFRKRELERIGTPGKDGAEEDWTGKGGWATIYPETSSGLS